MKKISKIFIVLIVLSLCSFTLFAHGEKERATVTILETSDMHGVVSPYDYATDSAQDTGLLKAYTVIKEEREKDPSLLLVDCGDTLQDNMIQEFRFDDPNPMISAMNYIGYDAWELGNHEFNFEFEALEKAMGQFKGTVLAANIYKADGTRFTNPYLIKEVNGVRVAIFGLEAPNIPAWEGANPEHYDYMTFTNPLEETEKVLKELEGKADLIICLAHYGEGGEYDSEGMDAVAEKYGDKIDAFLLGHAHSTLNKTLNGAVMLEPGSKASGVGKVTFTLERNLNGSWTVVEKKGEIIPVSKQNLAVDKDFEAFVKPLDEASKEMSNSVIGQVGEDFLPSLYWNDIYGIPTAVVQDTAMIDLINNIQLKETGADVAFTALFDQKSNLEKGDFKKRDGVKIYKYDNTLFAVKMTGKELKDLMEVRAGGFFNQSTPGDVTMSFDPNFRLYNYDMYQGVEYQIDISKPYGERIVNLTFHGEPLKDDQELVVAMNNYRYGTLKQNGQISSDPEAVVYDSGLALRDLISDYVKEQGTIMPECDNNWSLIGIDYDDADAEKIYQMIRDGKINLVQSTGGRGIDTSHAINANELRDKGII